MMSASGVVSLVLWGIWGYRVGGVDLAGVLCWSDGDQGSCRFDILGTTVDDICLARLGRVLGSRCKFIVFRHLGVYEAKSTEWAYTY